MRSNLTLIVAEDSHFSASLLFAVEAEGFPARVASDHLTELALLANSAAPCLIIDHRPPHLDGADLIARLRKLGCTTPAILISSVKGVQLKRAMTALNTAIVEKPLLGGELVTVLRTMTGCETRNS